jgi:hypothetical protein
MELASMLAGGRFGDRPVSVCPVIGSILRAYNDNVGEDRRQDLYRFAADAVDTRRDYSVQRRRADAALDWAGARYAERGGTLLATPDPEGPRDEIAYYVVGALGPRGRWSQKQHTAVIALVEELIEIDGGVSGDEALAAAPDGGALVALLGDFLEEAAQPVENRGGYHEFVLAEGLECGEEARREARPALLNESSPDVGEGGQDDPAIAIGSYPLDEPRHVESFEHLGHAGRAQVRGARQVADRHLRLIAKAEQQAVLRVGELARAAGLAPAHPSDRGHGAFERTGELLGGAALLALAYHVAKRR